MKKRYEVKTHRSTPVNGAPYYIWDNRKYRVAVWVNHGGKAMAVKIARLYEAWLG